ncbi:ORF6N domain-containing protein [Cupriavidus basilensis]|nr:ORF6N domain-containing protein [Cupriavidus basilensis]
MSSREIADLVEKRHDNVKRTIETLAERGVIAFPQTEEKPTAGRPAVEYHVGKRDSYIIVAQLSPEFTARLVDRWQWLEAQAAAGQPNVATHEGALLALQSAVAQQLRLIQDNARIAFERDHAIATKAEIGCRREATAMATASAAVRETAKLRQQLGFNSQHATIIAVENATGQEFAWRPLKKWCDAHGVVAIEVPDPRYGRVKAWPANAWGEIHGVDLEMLFPS